MHCSLSVTTINLRLIVTSRFFAVGDKCITQTYSWAPPKSFEARFDSWLSIGRCFLKLGATLSQLTYLILSEYRVSIRNLVRYLSQLNIYMFSSKKLNMYMEMMAAAMTFCT